jgi:hypothetical protein
MHAFDLLRPSARSVLPLEEQCPSSVGACSGHSLSRRALYFPLCKATSDNHETLRYYRFARCPNILKDDLILLSKLPLVVSFCVHLQRGLRSPQPAVETDLRFLPFDQLHEQDILATCPHTSPGVSFFYIYKTHQHYEDSQATCRRCHCGLESASSTCAPDTNEPFAHHGNVTQSHQLPQRRTHARPAHRHLPRRYPLHRCHYGPAERPRSTLYTTQGG